MNQSYRKIIIAISIWLSSFIVGNFLSTSLIYYMSDVSFSELTSVNIQETMESLSAGQIRLFVSLNHLFTFLVPGLLIAYAFYKDDFLAKLNLHKKPLLLNVVFGSCLLIICLPFALYVNFYSMHLPWPEFMRQGDSQVYSMMEILFSDNGISSILLNILLIGVIAATGEEIIFRGLIQRYLENKRLGHLAVWLTALAFGLFHLQADGMVARIILGAVLGYSLYFSSNLWIPIILHFIYNSFQVLMVEMSPEEVDLAASTQVNPGITWYTALGSLMISCIIIYYWNQMQSQHEES